MPADILHWIATVVRQRFQRCSYSFAMTRGARISPTPRRAGRDTPRRRRWAFIRPVQRIIVIISTLVRWGLDHPAPTTHENCIFAGPGIGRPSAEGNFIPQRYGLNSTPPDWELCSVAVRDELPSIENFMNKKSPARAGQLSNIS